jgi:hypothetical protein
MTMEPHGNDDEIRYNEVQVFDIDILQEISTLSHRLQHTVINAIHPNLFLALLLCASSFLLIRAPELLTPILPLLPLLSRRLLNLGRHTNPHFPVMWLQTRLSTSHKTKDIGRRYLRGGTSNFLRSASES